MIRTATLMAVAMLAMACGETTRHVSTLRTHTVTTPQPKGGPKLPPNHVGFVGRRTVNGFRFTALPYVVTSSLVDRTGSHNYRVYFRLNRLLPTFGRSTASMAMAIVTIDGGYDPFTGVYQFPHTTIPCYIALVGTAAARYEPGSSYLPNIVLPHGPGQVARVGLFTADNDQPTLEANVGVAAALGPDMIPAGAGPGGYTSRPEGPYGRLLGCQSRVPGEISWSRYQKLHREGKATSE